MVLVPKTLGEGKRPSSPFLPKTHGEGKRPLPSPWLWCEKHTAEARGRCFHDNTVKARSRCLHHGFGAKNTRPRQKTVAFTMLLVCFGEINTRCRQAAVAFTMIWVPITHTSPRFLCQKHTVKATGRCLHNGFGAKHTR